MLGLSLSHLIQHIIAMIKLKYCCYGINQKRKENPHLIHDITHKTQLIVCLLFYVLPTNKFISGWGQDT